MTDQNDTDASTTHQLELGTTDRQLVDSGRARPIDAATQQAADSSDLLAFSRKMQQYERLRLVEDPFKSSADPRYLYLGPEHSPVYRQVQTVIVRKRGLALVHGEPGMGKSTLARRIYDVFSNEKNIHIAYIPRTSFRSQFSALQTICAAFSTMEVPSMRNFDAQLEALKTKLTEAYRSKYNCVLILDDAQEMPKMALTIIHELYNFEYDDKIVQTIVFGQTEIVGLFKKNKAVNDRIFVSPKINPLTLTSTMQMVNHRLRTAGRNEPLFEEDAFQLLYDVSKGVPRDIVAICAISLDILMQRDLDHVNLEVMKEAVDIYGPKEE